MASIRDAHERLAAEGSIQLQFPSGAVEVPRVEPPAGAMQAADAVFWVVAIAICVALLAVMVAAARNHGLRRLPRAALPAPSPAAPMIVPPAVLADADALAAQGRYGEAVHALLLRGVAAIQERFPRALGPAHTSRDIAAMGVLPVALRTAFAGIAARAEQAVFAQAELRADDWAACRALYAGLLPAAPTPR